jgi:hypothetical protein
MTAMETVKRYLDAFFGGGPNLETIRNLLTDDFTFQGPLMTASNADDFIKQLEGMGSNMEMQAEIHCLIDDGERVAALYDFRGPHGNISFAEWYWIKRDKISAIKLHYDPRPLLESMGEGH